MARKDQNAQFELPASSGTKRPQRGRPRRSSADDPPRSTGPDHWPGVPLVQRIREKLADPRCELNLTTLASRLGLTQGALTAILTGQRATLSLVRDKERGAWLAAWLGIPQFWLRVLAGDIEHSELRCQIGLDEQLWLTAQKLQADPKWVGYAPPSKQYWDSLPLAQRLLVVELYEWGCTMERKLLMADAGIAPAHPAKTKQGKSDREPVVQEL
ncbi:hypothetical protein ABFG95_08025 [Achromobacter sp. HNDS-1]|uniref:HTH cro/C1-type domain-containing protein n=1 Tax=Achromobacter sp. HNDS-1 TaxID=3151598 RepID=A0AAU7LES8_9BURK